MSNKKNRTWEISEVSATYTQDMDSCEEGMCQILTIKTQDAGAGKYYVIETKRWAVENIEELTEIMKDFIGRTE